MRTIALVLTFAVAAALLTAAAPAASAFQGAVVDGNTGEPLEGAVVVVVWRRYSAIAVDHRSVVHKAIERLTDSRGEFSADDSTLLLPMQFRSRDVMVFKPGYRTLANETRDRRAPLFAERVIKLTKIRTLWEARQRSNTTQFICPSSIPPHDFCVPEAWLPNLIRILRVENRIYEAYPAGHFTVKEDP